MLRTQLCHDIVVMCFSEFESLLSRIRFQFQIQKQYSMEYNPIPCEFYY